MSGPARTRVVRVDDIAGIGEIAARYGVGSAAVTNWTRRYRHFPKPIAILACGPVFDISEVSRWFDENPPWSRS